MEVIEDVFERETVLLAERDDNGFFVGGGLQFEPEAAAESFSQRQSPGAVDSSAEGRVQDHLHAAGFVEEAFEHEALLSWDGAQGGAAFVDVIRDLQRGFWVEIDFTLQHVWIAAFFAKLGDLA